MQPKVTRYLNSSKCPKPTKAESDYLEQDRARRDELGGTLKNLNNIRCPGCTQIASAWDSERRAFINSERWPYHISSQAMKT